MQKGMLLLLTTLAPQLWASPCLEPVGANKTETRTLKSFDTLLVKGNLDVEIRKGGAPRVELAGPENFLANVDTRQSGNELILRNENCLKKSDALKIVVYTDGLKNLLNEGSADIKLFDAMTADRSRIAINGSGDLEGDLNTKTLEIAIAGSGDIKLKGGASKLNVSIQGSGDLEARELDAKDVDITISGSGDAGVKASDSLKAEINGSGDIRYKGAPKSLSVRANGSGSVEKD